MGGGGGLCAKHLLPYCCVRDSLKYDMQHDHILKKLNFDLLTPIPMIEGGGGAGGVCGQSICYYVAAFTILFNLICNMTMF